MINIDIKKILKNVLIYGSLILWSLVIIIPIITILFGSFKTFDEFTVTNGITAPQNFLNLENYKKALIEGKMLIGFVNTFILLLGVLL